MSKEKVEKEEEGIEEWSSSQSESKNNTEEEGEYEEVIPEIQNIWLPSEKGETLAGKVTELDEGQYGVYAIIQREDGSTIQTPAHKYLQSRVELLSVGDQVKIEFTGTVKSQKGQNTRLYKMDKLRKEKEQ